MAHTESSARVARVVSVVAATMIALACGTNYVYSAWAPQFAAKLNLSSTESNLIGTAANFGMYATGIPMGVLIDARGPRIPVVIGAFALGIGYYPMHKAYDNGPGSMNVALLCFFSLLTGCGSCVAFSGSLKTCALNWPNHRGTATAFPLAGFGLSAFFFATLASLAFPDNTSEFLLLLAVGTFTMVFVSLFFLRIAPTPTSYSALPPNQVRPRSNSSRLRRQKPDESPEPGRISRETRRKSDDTTVQHRHHQSDTPAKDPTFFLDSPSTENDESAETASLMSASSSSGPGDLLTPKSPSDGEGDDAYALDIRGLSLLPVGEFWQLFSTLALLSGVGLMTINNIGNDAQALWSHYDDSVSADFIQKRQLMHVSILSVASFVGRILSGIGSDHLVKKMNMSRFWCLVAASTIFCAAQICAIRIENPHHLWAVSGLSGLGYGVLYGVFPAMVTEAFGVHGFSQNWGCMTLAPIISGNIFNLLYGRIYDHHSTVLPSGERTCPDGLNCYRAAYWVTFAAALVGFGVSLWSIRTDHIRRTQRARNEVDVGRVA